MATINFYLDRADSEGKHPIFLVYQSKGRKFKYYTQEKLLNKYWDKKKQRAKHISDAGEINDILDFLEAKIKKIERHHRMSSTKYSFEDIKKAFLNKKEKKVEIIEFFEKIIEQVKGTHQVKSLKEYQTVINDLIAYETHYGTELSFDKIDVQFFSKYLSYLFDERKNSQNTVAKKISTFKTLMNYATKAGVNQKVDYQDFKVKKVDTEKVFLTNEELFKMYEHDLSDNKKLDKVRDVFCFGCFTGLRYSDIRSLSYDLIVERKGTNGEKTYSLRFQVYKTRDILEVPLNQYALAIIEKYEKMASDAIKSINAEVENLKIGRKILPVISNQKMNSYLKDLGELVKINTPFVVTKYIGTKREDKTYYKYELLATHAARRTFAVLSLEKGMRVEVLQKILGHKSIRTTMKYVFILEDVKRQQMQEAWNDAS